MRRARTAGTIEEAKNLISEYLLQERKRQGKAPRRRDSWTHKEQVDRVERTNNGEKTSKDVLAGYVADEETGAVAVYQEVGELFILFFLNSYEADPKHYTYPFRNVRRGDLRLLLTFGAIFYKPERAISLDEALTPEGAEAVYGYPRADEGDTWEKLVFDTWKPGIEEFARENYFIEREETDGTSPSGKAVVMLCRPLPSILEELTGVSIRNEEDYVKALEKRLERELSAAEKRQAEGIYVTLNGGLLLSYAAYEFARTESYAHLQEILSSYGKFGLPEDWYSWTYSRPSRENAVRYETAEQEVISRYLATIVRKSAGAEGSLQDIADVTGIPYPELLKAERIEFWT